MKQNHTSHFQRYPTLIQHWCLTNVETTLHNVDTMFNQRCFNVTLMLVKVILNPVGPVMIVDLQIDA